MLDSCIEWRHIPLSTCCPLGDPSLSSGLIFIDFPPPSLRPTPWGTVSSQTQTRRETRGGEKEEEKTCALGDNRRLSSSFCLRNPVRAGMQPADAPRPNQVESNERPLYTKDKGGGKRSSPPGTTGAASVTCPAGVKESRCRGQPTGRVPNARVTTGCRGGASVLIPLYSTLQPGKRKRVGGLLASCLFGITQRDVLTWPSFTGPLLC